MGIFSEILGKIFPASHPAVAAASNPPAATAAAPEQAAATGAGPASSPPVDVGAVLSGLAAKNPEKLNYQSSIVDLLKLLGLDSSLDARKSLANELHYSGDTSDSAAMNMWLHKEVVQKLADNGGTVPDSLKH